MGWIILLIAGGFYVSLQEISPDPPVIEQMFQAGIGIAPTQMSDDGQNIPNDTTRANPVETSSIGRAQWVYADEYLQTLNQAAENGFLDLMIPGSHEYEEAELQALTSLIGGADIQKTSDLLAAEWNEITERYGVEKQRAIYSEWLKLPNAY